MADANEIRFHNNQLLTGNTGTIDEQGGVIRGASLIQKGEAEGHGLLVDDHLLSQIQASGKEKGKVPINLDHGSGITSTCGFISGFRIDGDKLRGDIHLLKSHPEYPVILERAARMPDCFGLSTAFLPEERYGKVGEAVGGGKYAARCGELKSVDLVCRPAANAGLFSVPEEVDSSRKSMAKETKKETKFAEGDPEPTMQDVLAAIQEIGQRQVEQDQFNQQIVDHLQGGTQGEEEGPTLQQLVDMDDAELASHGLTREEVDAAVAEVLAAMEGGEHESTSPGEGEGELVGAGAETAGAGAPAGMTGISGEAAGGTNLASLKKEIQQLKNKQKIVELTSKREAEEVQFAEIEQKILVLADQRDKAIALAEKLEAENDALRMAVRTGTRPVKAGAGEDGMRMFGANENGQLHEFQVRVKQLEAEGKSPGQAIELAVKENPARHRDWINSQQKPAA